MENNSQIHTSSLVNILTLRYDPSITPNLIPKTPKDFSLNQSNVDLQNIEDSICNEIKNKLKSDRDTQVSIALSGGVDSTLALTLLRKNEPEKKNSCNINKIC